MITFMALWILLLGISGARIIFFGGVDVIVPFEKKRIDFGSSF